MADGVRFPNALAVIDYLDASGWRAGKSTVYLHVKQGRLKPDPDGHFGVRAVLKYAKGHLKRKDGAAVTQDQDQYQQDKARAETRKLQAQAEHWEIKTKVAAGRYVERSALEHELAMRASIFKNDIESFFRSRAGEIINLVDGIPERAPDLVQYLLEQTEEWMNRYASDREYHVPTMQTPQDDPDTDEDEDEL